MHDAKILVDEEFKEIVTILIEALQDHDWDCEQDSDYWDHPLVREAFKKLHPGWDWDDEG